MQIFNEKYYSAVLDWKFWSHCIPYQPSITKNDFHNAAHLSVY